MMKPKTKKRFHLNRALRRYYKAYYNDNFLRNFRFIHDKEQSFVNKEGETIKYYANSLNAFKYGEKDTSINKASNWLITKSKANDGTLAGEITYYKNLNDFKEGAIEKRFCDRLFFDFDIDDSPEVKILKSEFKRANDELEGKELTERLRVLQKDFQDLIFNSDLLFDVFNETKALSNYLAKYGLKPYLIASGSKGFHINVFFDEMQLSNLSQISQTLALSYKKELNLKYLDFNVFDRDKIQKRLQRVQYGIHSKTNLLTTPLPSNCPYDEMLTILKKNKRRPIDFRYDEMLSPEGFNNMLKRLDREISFKNAQRKKELDEINKAKRQRLQKKYGKNYKSFNDIDLRDIANAYGIDGKRQGERMIVSCPFHNDTHPSSVVFKERFYCSTCNMTLNYYDFISKLEGTEDKDKIMQIARQFLR